MRDQIDKCIAGLCWGGFHSALARAIHTLAYRCYVRWVGEPAPLPQEAQEKSLKRTVELDIDEEFTANKRSKVGEGLS